MSISKTFTAKSGAELEIVSFNDIFENGSPVEKRKATKLLKNVYDGIYTSTFPLPEEREEFSDWIEYLEAGRLEEGQLLTAFGRNLDSDNPEIMGFLSCCVLGDSSCGLVDYRIRAKEYRDLLSGAEITSHAEKTLSELNQQINGCDIKLIFGEINDPKLVKWDINDPNRHNIDCMSPQKRLDHFTKNMGYKLIGIDYFQVPLQPCATQQEVEEGKCSLLLMMHNPERFKDAKAEDLEKAITFYCKATAEVESPYDLKDPDINKMMNQIQLMKEYEIPLLEEQQTDFQKNIINNAGTGRGEYIIKYNEKRIPLKRAVPFKDFAEFKTKKRA